MADDKFPKYLNLVDKDRRPRSAQDLPRCGHLPGGAGAHLRARVELHVPRAPRFLTPATSSSTFIGEDRVICVRDNDGQPQVLMNSCRHRGNAVCRAEEGHATSFMCTYHGWTYDLKGNLVGVPGFKEVYHEELDRENWGLITRPRRGIQGLRSSPRSTWRRRSCTSTSATLASMGIDQMVARGDTDAGHGHPEVDDTGATGSSPSTTSGTTTTPRSRTRPPAWPAGAAA